jgi:hypothetical protein
MLTEEIPQPLSTTCEMHAKEMGVDPIGKGLRNEPDEEANDLIIINGVEPGGTEVDERCLGSIAALCRPPHHSSTNKMVG